MGQAAAKGYAGDSLMVLIQRINDFYSFFGVWLKVFGAIGLVTLLVAIAVHALDRDPPFKVLAFEPVSAHACQEVALRAKVWRDTGRGCSVDMSRSLIDSANGRKDYGDVHFSAKALAEIDAESPGEMAPKIVIPCSTANGDAKVITSRRYSCNQVQRLPIFQIDVTTVQPVTILPP